MTESRSFYFVLLIFTALQSGCCLFAPSHHRIEDYKPVFADASAGNIDAVRRAVENDRTVLTAREWDDATLLHLAVGQNHKELTEFLLDKGADVNALTMDRLTPLHMAAQNGNLEIVQLLLSRKSKIDAVDSKGWTPLDRARRWRHQDVADFLIQKGGHGASSLNRSNGSVAAASSGADALVRMKTADRQLWEFRIELGDCLYLAPLPAGDTCWRSMVHPIRSPGGDCAADQRRAAWALPLFAGRPHC